MQTTSPENEFETMIKNLVPMIAYSQMQVLEVSDDTVAIKIPFIKENKNHLNSMYFGSLSVGADAAGGILALHHAKKAGKEVAIVFKDFNADFLKRAEGDTIFSCNDGKAIADLVAIAVATGERQNMPVNIEATVDGSQDAVARFVLTLSIKQVS